MWKIFGKKTVNKPTTIRIEAEDLLEQGYTCLEVAGELNATQEEIYRIKSAKTRREARLRPSSDGVDGIGELPELKLELQRVQLQDRIDEAKHKAYLRDMERREYEEEEPEIAASSTPDQLMQNLLMNAILKKKGNDSIKVSNQGAELLGVVPKPQSPAVDSNSAPIAPPSFDKIKLGIKSGVVTKEQFLEQFMQTGATEADAGKIYEYIKKKL